MIVHNIVIVISISLLHVGFASTAAVSTSNVTQWNQPVQQNHRPNNLRISECAARGGECDETKAEPVCGTDDQTYPSRCHLTRIQCSGHQVGFKYRGTCQACKEARDYAIKHTGSKFIPRCKTDGTYAALQCMPESGCWCSDITGKPLKNTMTRTGKPNCRRFGNLRRRSPPRFSNMHQVQRSCSQQDRLIFNGNLLSKFRTEYERQLRSSNLSGASINLTTLTESHILDWKFALLDVNSNHMLDKQEFRELRKLIKRAVKPKSCGRVFGKLCDVDEDDRLSRSEWGNCISKNQLERRLTNIQQINIEQSISQRPKQNPNNQLKPTINFNDNNESAEIDDNDEDDDNNNPNLSPMDILQVKSDDLPLKESESESNCMADREAAQEAQRSDATSIYVPECTPDGQRYQKVQCYSTTDYCWCVHEDTGKEIPKTVVKNKRPHCDVSPLQPRTMKGCPEARKIVFLRDVKKFLKQYITESHISRVNNITEYKSEDERTVAISFHLFDSNQNNIFEKKEWKAFRELMTNSKTLRKCGKKLPRYCDENNDKKITQVEWFNCLQIQSTNEHATLRTSESITTKPSRLIGSNPLDQYLMD